jgi:hypothetical protein
MDKNEAVVLGKLEEFKGVLEFAYLTIKSLFLVNGGAIIALLSLVGTLWRDEPKIVKVAIASIQFFSLGLFLATLIPLLCYWAQSEYVKDQLDKADAIRNKATILAVSSSFAFFLGSAYVFCNIDL